MPEVTADQLRQALAEARGVKSRAARALDMSRSTFRDACERHGVEYDEEQEEAALEAFCAAEGVPLDDVGGYWVKTGEMSVFVRRKDGPPSYLDERDRIIAAMQAHAPAYEPITYSPEAENLLVIDFADVHVGKLSVPSEVGEAYDIAEAVRRMEEGVRGLLAKAAPHGISAIVVVMGNDDLHVDSAHNTTTSGTRQDMAGAWHTAFDACRAAYVRCIEHCATVAPVHILHCPANHNFTSGYMLTDAIACWFHAHPGVTAERRSVDMKHRKYIEYGANLLGFTHGDGAKESDLHALALKEARESFSRTRRVWWHCHHLHHKIRKIDGLQVEKDQIGATVIRSAPGKDRDDACVVEYIRSPSPADGWHHRNGYVGAVQALEAFVYSPQSQIARFTHEF